MDRAEDVVRDIDGEVRDGVVRGGAVPHHVLWVSTLCDETDWLVPVLDAHVFGGAMGVRMFGSSPEIGNSAGTRLILCSIRPSSWGAR